MVHHASFIEAWLQHLGLRVADAHHLAVHSSGCVGHHVRKSIHIAMEGPDLYLVCARVVSCQKFCMRFITLYEIYTKGELP